MAAKMTFITGISRIAYSFRIRFLSEDDVGVIPANVPPVNEMLLHEVM